jgi:hypothetical protein
MRVVVVIVGLVALTAALMVFMPVASGLWSKTLGIGGQVGVATFTPTPTGHCITDADAATDLCPGTPTPLPAKQPKPTASVPVPVFTQSPVPTPIPMRFTPMPVELTP